jgi:hypothetical protein
VTDRDSKHTLESFRESLRDVVVIAERLECRTVEELLGVCNLALDNDGQLHLLSRVVLDLKK